MFKIIMQVLSKLIRATVSCELASAFSRLNVFLDSAVVCCHRIPIKSGHSTCLHFLQLEFGRRSADAELQRKKR
jgi:hypothetical protein